MNNTETYEKSSYDFSYKSLPKITPSFEYNDDNARERTINESLNELITYILKIRDKLWILNPCQADLTPSETGTVLYDLNLRLDKAINLTDDIYKELNNL